MSIGSTRLLMVMVYLGGLLVGIPHSYALFALTLALIATAVSPRTVSVAPLAYVPLISGGDDDFPATPKKRPSAARTTPFKVFFDSYGVLLLLLLVSGAAYLVLALTGSLKPH